MYHFNGFNPMNYSMTSAAAGGGSSSHFSSQHSMMFNGGNVFGNPSPLPRSSTMNFNFMGNQQQYRSNNYQLPPPLQPSSSSSSIFNVPPSTSGLIPSSNTKTMISNNFDTKEPQTAREVFDRTLMTSLKEANKRFSGKTTTWKNPFMYKTTLCDNYASRSYCRYGVNCWYAHGIHELRCMPDSEELPPPDFIAQYLSFLGLPKNVLEDIIAYAYKNADEFAEHRKWFKPEALSVAAPSTTAGDPLPELPSFGSTSSASPDLSIKSSPPLPTSTSTTNPLPFDAFSNGYHASVGSNGGGGIGDWSTFRPTIAMDGGETNGDLGQLRNNFAKSFHLFK